MPKKNTSFILYIPRGEDKCPNCLDTGVGLLGVHEIPGFERVDDGDQGFLIPTMEYQEEYGSPCPTCGMEDQRTIDENAPNPIE